MNLANNWQLGFGTYKLDQLSDAELKQLILTAYQSGYHYLDTASWYHNEAQIGRIYQQLKQELGTAFVFPIQTKIWPSQYLEIEAALLTAFKHLQVEVIDCVLLHRPSFNFVHDLYAWSVLVKYQQLGKIKHIGVSNYDRELVTLLTAISGVQPEFNQIQFNLYYPKFDRVHYFQEIGVKLQAWRPLTGYFELLKADPVVLQMAQNHQTDVYAIALAYVKACGLGVVVKSQNPLRIQNNAAAFFHVALSEQEVEILKNHSYFAPKSFYPSNSSSYPLSDDTLVSQLKKQLVDLKLEKAQK